MPLALAPPQPDIDESMLAKARTRDAVEVCQTLRRDFLEAMNALIAKDAEPGCARRNVVRCFGSLIEGLTEAMRTVAVVTCEFHGKDYNRFLQAKSIERGAANHTKIYHSYRIIHEALPKSPLARVPDERWDKLHACLEIRNRVVHPRAPADLELSDQDLMLIGNTATEFVRDFDIFAQWHFQKQQKLGWERTGIRRREFRKIGRNEKCPCGSQRKYKDCCAAAQY